MSVSLEPLGDNIIVEPSEQEMTTSSGIILPETAKEKPQKGTVLAVGPGSVLKNGQRRQMEIQVGDQVLYAKYGGSTFKVGGRELLILREDDVLAKIV